MKTHSLKTLVLACLGILCMCTTTVQADDSYLPVGGDPEFCYFVAVAGSELPEGQEGDFECVQTNGTLFDATAEPPTHSPISVTPAAATVGANGHLPGTGSVAVTPTSDETKVGKAKVQVTFQRDREGKSKPSVWISVDEWMVYTANIISPHIQDDGKICVPYTGANNANEFSYSAASPGVLTIPVKVQTVPDDAGLQTHLVGKVKTSITAIAGSTLNWDGAATTEGTATYTSPYWVSTATFTTLPPVWDDFGRKTVTVKVETITKTADVEVFFDRDSTNNPGFNRHPNWFFYWAQTSAGFGNPQYDNTQPHGSAEWINNAWVAFIGYADNGDYTPPMGGDNGGILLDGIDNFAWTCRHEWRHVQTLSSWYPQGYEIAIDQDQDMIPDAQEATLGGTQQNPINGGHFDPTEYDTDGDGMRDVEDYTIATQKAWIKGSADSKDWANPGHQWSR